MPGFFITNQPYHSVALHNYCKAGCVENCIRFKEYTVMRNTLDKFMNDKLFFDTDEYIVVIEGVILNSRNLIRQTGSADFRCAVLRLIDDDPKTFFKAFRGSFSGAMLNKATDEWIAYTNQTGEKQVFYYCENGKLIIASQVNYILDMVREKRQGLSLDKQAVYSTFAYMFVYGEHTFANEIKRLTAGQYLVFGKNNEIQLYSYHIFSKNKYNLEEKSLDEIADELNALMIEAVKLEFDKDLEYGYKHIADMSGGFDCRMTTWIAHEYGYKDILNIHYSQNGCSDQIVSQKIALALKNKIIIMSLSDISFIFDVQKNTKMLYGLSMYCSSTGANNILGSLDMTQYGLEHTGMLGDIIIGTCLDGIANPDETKPRKVISSKLIDKLDTLHCTSFSDTELQILYTRGMNGALNSSAIRQNYTEIAAPFIDIDVFEYCMSVPLRYRSNRILYNRWVNKYYPVSALIENAASGRKINDSAANVFLNRLKKVPRRLAQKLSLKNSAQNEGMNPFIYWWNDDERFRAFIQEFYSEHIQHDFIPVDIREDIQYVFGDGNAKTTVEVYEKLMVISVLAAIELYFGDMN